MSNEITYESMRRPVGVTAAAAADPVSRILTSPVLPQDVKAQLKDEALRKRITSRCKELLRQLRAKIGINRTKYDTDEARAAMVLEFVLRTGLPGDGRNSVKSVHLGVLAAQVGVRKEFAEDTQRALAHYLNDAAEVVDGRLAQKRSGSALNNTIARGGAGNGMSSSGGGPSQNAGNESNAVIAAARGIVIRSLQQPETIRDLSISLGSLIEDADGSARRGEALFETLAQHIMNSTNKYSQKAQLSDLQRNKSAYEAACFYLSVNDAEGAGGGSTKKKLNTSKVGAGDSALSDEDEERILSISDIMDAAKLGNKKDFEEIVRGVSKIAAEIRVQRPANIDKECKTRERAEQLRTCSSASSTNSSTKRAKKRRGDSEKDERRGQILPQDILMAAQEKEWSNDVSGDGANPALKGSKRGLPAFVPSAAFLEWKKQTLDDAIARAKEEAGDEEMTNQEALEWVVKNTISQNL
jgi:predicted NUDIX family phosphoesterase